MNTIHRSVHITHLTVDCLIVFLNHVYNNAMVESKIKERSYEEVIAPFLLETLSKGKPISLFSMSSVDSFCSSS